jgi:osmoprotectant transport system permease protein
VNVISDVLAWLTDPAQWSGPDGIPVRTLQHLGYSLVATAIAIAVACLSASSSATPAEAPSS